MSKDEKNPVPEDRLEHFMGIVWSLVGPFGIDQHSEVMDYVTFLSESVERQMFENRHKVSPQKKVYKDRAKFIAVFKARYLEMTDLEYKRPVTAIDGKLIHQANKALQDGGFTCDDYLKWTYETFMPENPKFAPGTLKQVCAEHFIHKFLFDHKEERVERQKSDLARKEGHALLNKARGMIRASTDHIFIEKVKNIVKQYSDGSIMLTEFRKELKKLEAEA